MNRLSPFLFPLVLVGFAPISSGAFGAPPPANRGLIAIWYEKKPYLLDLPFIKGGQVVAQWRDMEPREGKYDFSTIDAGLEALAGRQFPATVQINGNLKPEWLFDVVPYCSEKFSTQTRDEKGTLMYWHPRHEKAYLDMIRAYADHLKNSPARSRILGVRLNFDAVGTEHFLSEKTASSIKGWITPPGAEPGPAWTPEWNAAYQANVVRAFVDAFAPDIKLFVRNNLDEGMRKPFEQDFRSGKLGWFHTSSEMEPRPNGEGKYRTFIDYCRSGQTVAYAEPWADAWGRHGGKTDPRWCSAMQFNYWRLLCDLNCGVSYIALYGADLDAAAKGATPNGKSTVDQEEFRQAFEFAARYAGYHASPEQSPGAWVALREGNTLKGDYTFLMERVGDAGAPEKLAGPADQRFGAWARALDDGQAMRFRLDPALAARMAKQPSRIRVVYLDEGAGSFEVKRGDGGAAPLQRIDKKNTGRWQEAMIDVPASAAASSSAGWDIELAAKERTSFHMLEVQLPDTP